MSRNIAIAKSFEMLAGRQAIAVRAEAAAIGVLPMVSASMALDGLLQLTADWYWEVDAAGIFTFMPTKSQVADGMKAIAIDSLHPEDVSGLRRLIQDGLAFRDYEMRIKGPRRENAALWISCSGEPVFGALGDVVGFRGVASDLKKRLADSHALVSLANTDPLTGLPDRRSFGAELHKAVESPETAPFAVAIVDFDNFKLINDTLGHDAGDQLLIAMMRRFQDSVGEDDVIARLGGDEFALILRGVDESRGLRSRVEAIYDAVKQPVSLGGVDRICSVSMGLALFPTHSTEPSDLMKKADVALYSAKNGGKGQHSIYHSSYSRASEKKIRLFSDIEHAIDAGDLILYYQPVVDVSRRALAGVEALLRWRRPEGIVAAGRFADVFENASITARIGRFVTNEAIKQAAWWRHHGVDFGKVSINVTTADFLIGDFPSWLAFCLANHRLRSSDVCVEVTESMLLDGSSRAVIDGLNAVRGMGAEIAFDDFGTGHAALSHLKMPFDRLKIDRSFVPAVYDDEVNVAIVGSIIALAKKLGKKVTAEGVETEEQARILSDLGCTDLQGFLYSQAIPGEELPHFIESLSVLEIA